VAGDEGAPLVLLLHGFPQSLYSWRDQVPALGENGFHAVAVNQRGYSPGARPVGIDAYKTPLIVADALAIADALGAERFHLVGHDWGGQIAWLLAAQHPNRLKSLAMLSRPHPAAFARAWAEDPKQQERSKHHRAFQNPDTAELLLADGARRLRRNLKDQGVPNHAVDAYVETLSDPGALDAALNWYRAMWQGGSALAAADVPAVSVPTLYLWGEADATVGTMAAVATADFVTGPYHFVAIPGAGHFLTDDVPEAVTEHLLEFVKRYDR
jgi:pimeloyl-ACP methyl ester carboxylesterase